MDANVTGYLDLTAADCENTDTWIGKLRDFVSSNKNAFRFVDDEDVGRRRQFTDRLLEIIYKLTDNGDDEKTIEECLSALLIMSRDAQSMHGYFANRRTWDALTRVAGLKSQVGMKPLSVTYKTSSVISSCKCLCNLIFLTKDSNQFCSDTDFLKLLLSKLSDQSLDAVQQDSRDLEFLYVRLVFLASALNSDARFKIVKDYNGRNILVNLLNSKVRFCTAVPSKSPNARATIEECHAKTCCEIFKTIFNLNMKIKNEEKKIQEEDVVKECETIISLCHKFLLTMVASNENFTRRLHADTQNCLYSIVASCYKDSMFIPSPSKISNDEVFSYGGPDLPIMEEHDLSAVLTILLEVERKVRTEEISTDNFLPVLSLLSSLSRSSRIIRKYCKSYIIPPRKDFVNRPEVGPELRNKLIKLFTHANTDVKAAAADFVFVLCKEDVDRLVKYTGYGNAAGLLASRGLLAGGKGDTVYSDADSDSDTEEYREHADEINPITGHIPPEMPDPMEGMSEDQKEYLAVQLANQLTKLSNDDVIKPVCVDPKTGKLIPFQQKFHETVLPEEKDSDDDDSD